MTNLKKPFTNVSEKRYADFITNGIVIGCSVNGAVFQLKKTLKK